MRKHIGSLGVVVALSIAGCADTGSSQPPATSASQDVAAPVDHVSYPCELNSDALTYRGEPVTSGQDIRASMACSLDEAKTFARSARAHGISVVVTAELCTHTGICLRSRPLSGTAAR